MVALQHSWYCYREICIERKANQKQKDRHPFAPNSYSGKDNFVKLYLKRISVIYNMGFIPLIDIKRS